jgi:DNA-binding NtrC family response regulator
MYAAQRKALTMLHEHKISVDEAEELLDAMALRGNEPPAASIPKVEFIGVSEWAERFRKTLDKIASASSPVLIQGEPGTGKELIARIIHYNSRYAGGPFVGVNCAGIPESLFESELFGHERGAFTGAVAQRIGKFEQANGGTIFLGPIDETPPRLQAKLHGFLRDGYFTRVHGTKPIHVDVRVIGATHGNLKEMVDQGRFRSDLYYSLSVCMVQSAPLRERLEDLPALVNRFVERQAEKDGRKPPKVSDAAMKMLYAYKWPENVRELANIISKAVVLCEGDEITPEHLPDLKTA